MKTDCNCWKKDLIIAGDFNILTIVQFRHMSTGSHKILHHESFDLRLVLDFRWVFGIRFVLGWFQLEIPGTPRALVVHQVFSGGCGLDHWSSFLVVVAYLEEIKTSDMLRMLL